MKESVFSKLISGELPCVKVYEDEHTFAFMDLYPIQEGMVVIVPKQQIALVDDLPPEISAAFMATIQTIMKAQRKAFLDKEKIGVQIIGINTPDHAHACVFPVNTAEEYLARSPKEPADMESLNKAAERIRANL